MAGKKAAKTDAGALPADIAAMGFEEALCELGLAVPFQRRAALVGGNRLFELALAVLEPAHDLLELAEAQSRVDKIVLGPDGAAAGVEDAGLE